MGTYLIGAISRRILSTTLVTFLDAPNGAVFENGTDGVRKNASFVARTPHRDSYEAYGQRARHKMARMREGGREIAICHFFSSIARRRALSLVRAVFEISRTAPVRDCSVQRAKHRGTGANGPPVVAAVWPQPARQPHGCNVTQHGFSRSAHGCTVGLVGR